MAQGGKTWPADDVGLWQERADHRFQCGGAQDHRLFAATRMQQAVGKHMPTFGIGGQLRFVERDKRQIGALRHRLCRAQQPARVFGLDPFFAGDQRDPVGPLDGDDPVIGLTCEQAQRKPDRTRRMAAQTFDREVGFAGVGRAQHGAHIVCVPAAHSFASTRHPARTGGTVTLQRSLAGHSYQMWRTNMTITSRRRRIIPGALKKWH